MCTKSMFEWTFVFQLSGALINLLMSKYLHDNTAIDALSEQLREICPTIYSADDALYTKVCQIVFYSTTELQFLR